MFRSITSGMLRWLIGVFAILTASSAFAADLQVSQYSASPDPIGATAVATFTVSAANTAASAVANPVITITIANRFQVTNAPGNFPAYCALAGAVGSQTLTCALPTLQPGLANAQSFSYSAQAISAGTSSSTATIAAAGNTDANPGNNALTISPTVRAGADLAIAKTGSAPNVIAGGALQYTLTVTNTGPNTTAAVHVTDNLPAASDFLFQSATGTNWTCGQSGGTVTCDYTGAAPAVGAAYPVITIAGVITKNTAGTISNIANVSISDALVLDPNGANNNSNTVVTNVLPGSDLQAIKSMPATLTVGSPSSIVLSIRNTGPQDVPAGATITDVIDASLAIGTMPSGCAKSGQTVTCTSGAMTSAQQTNFTIPVTGASATAGILTNTADVAPPAGFNDPDLTNNQALAPFQVVLPNADLELYAKYKGPNPVAPGADITSTIIVRNLGPSVATYAPATPIRITDTLSADETYVASDAAWSCSAAGTLVTCATTGSGTLSVGGTITLTLTTRAGAGVDTTVTNTACTDRTANSGHLPSSPTSPTGNDCRSAGVRSTTQTADLSVAKDMSLSPSGGWTKALSVADTTNTFYIRLRVSNAAGGGLARSVAVSDALPNFITSGSYVTAVVQDSSTSGAMSYNPANGLVSWNLANLAGGSTETLVIRVDRPFESGSFTNFASVFSPDTTELNTANNTDSANFTITPLADMTVNAKSVTPNPVRVGVPATYIVSLRNDGANPADNVQMIDVIDPAHFAIIGTPTTTKPGASCAVAAATGTVTCDMGQFVRTEVRQISITVLPKYPFGSDTMASLPVAQINRATVTTSTRDANGGTDPNAGNNVFSLSHQVLAPSFDLGVTKTETNPLNDDPIRFDETLNYDIRVSNYGPSRATDVTLAEIPAPPAGLSVSLTSVAINPVAASPGLSLQSAPNAGCAPTGATYVCKIDQSNAAANVLDPGQQVIFRVKFTIAGTPPATAVTMTNTAQLTSAEQPVWNGAGADMQTANNQAIQTTTIRPSTDLEILSKTRSGALVRAVNEPVEFTIRFRNNGPSTSAKVRISDALPAGFTYVATPAPSAAIPGGSTATVSALACSGTSVITCDIDGNFPVGAANVVDLKVNAKALNPYSGAIAPTDATDTATITPGLDGLGDPLSEDGVATNNSQSAAVQIRPSTITGTVYADNNNSNGFDGGEGVAGVTITLSGTDIFGNPVAATAVSNASGSYSFGVLPPSDATGYTIVETQPAAYYDLAETAGTAGGTVNNASFGNGAAQNTISGIILPALTDATGYIFQDHARAVIAATHDNPPAVNGGTGQANLVNAYANDTSNTAAIDPAKVLATIVTPASHAGVTMDLATGMVSVAPGTPAGTYTIDYQICDKADPATCATARVTVIVTAPPVAATNDTYSGVNGATGAANVLQALAGDTLNGAAATTGSVTITVATGSSVPAVLTFDTATGTTSVKPNTPAGTYSFTYQICDKLNPGNCAIATETISVTTSPVTAANDAATGINGASGASNVLNVLNGDTRNGAAATAADVTITLAPGATVPAGLTFTTATGMVSVNPGTPAGTYVFNYRICETINPTNCAIAEASISVVAAPITAAHDSIGAINGANGATNVLNVLGGDTLNGASATTGTVTITLATGATVPAGLTFDTATGQISVNPGTPAGSYSFDYKICEKLNPANCRTATATITVVAAPITADDDTSPPVTGASGAAGVVDVLPGDTLNNAPALLSAVNITIVTPATPIGGGQVPVLNPATGLVDVPAGTPAGSYQIAYQICEKLNPANCAIGRVTVPVTAATITAGADSAAGINGATGAANVLGVLGNDRLNGIATTPATVTIGLAPGATVPAGLTFDTATGQISVNPATPAGSYSFQYQICEKLNLANCATATAAITVVAAPIAAKNDSTSGIVGATGSPNALAVLDGDTLNGAPATTATVTISLPTGATVPAGLGFDPATGILSINPATPAGGYSFQYQICEKLNPANCATATATVTVIPAPIMAVDDTIGGINGISGGTNVLAALAGDTLNGAAATPATVIMSPAPGATVPAGLTFTPATGATSVNPGTPAGTYSFQYQICEKLNPANCATAKETISVVAAPIAAANDTASGINGASGAADVLNVLSGDTLNGAAAPPASVTITVTSGATVPAALTFDPATGMVSVNPGTPAGTYSFAYTICEKLNPANCATATAAVTVVAAPIKAVNDIATDINGANGGANVVNAFTGDTINGQPATPANATLSLAPGAVLPAGISFDPATGFASVAPNTHDGTYSFAYQLCEKLNPTNCTTATLTITIIPPRSSVTGVVYYDANMDRTRQSSEAPLAGWLVEVLRNGQVAGTTRTDATGAYAIADLLSGAGYSIQFRHPASNVVYGRILTANLPANAALANQDGPVDPSGVVYDAMTRQPISGARVALVDANGIALAPNCFIDPSQASQTTGADGYYQFDVVSGANAQCPAARTEYRLQVIAPGTYSNPVSTVLPPMPGSLNPATSSSTIVLASAGSAGGIRALAVVPNSAAPAAGQPATYYLSFLIAANDPNVVNNHIPLDPFLTRTPLLVTKTSLKRTANIGDLVPYTITLRNTEPAPRAMVTVADILPAGFRYVPGSARVNNVASEPVTNGRELLWQGQLIAGNATATYQIVTVVGAGVTQGDRINTALARNGYTGGDISNRAEAIVSIVPSAIFDCAEVIGKVFDDRNGNGYQDQDEPGIPGARLATVNGQLVTADAFGRYHITCAAVPNAQIGSNFVLKLDTRTVPEGYAPTQDNPQSIRLTRGKISELNFGVQKARVVAIALDARAFAQDGAELQPAFAQRLTQLAQIKAQRLLFQITYATGPSEPAERVKARLASIHTHIEALFRKDWDGPAPVIETNIINAAGRENVK